LRRTGQNYIQKDGVMRSPIRLLACMAVLAVMLSACTSTPPAAPAASDTQPLPPDRTMRALSGEVFTYGYPLVLMDVTRELMVARTPPNTFTHKRAVVETIGTAVPRPNADTLTSSAWLDLSQEPVVLSLPDTAGRYYVMSLIDAWTNVFAAPGKRTSGTRRGTFLVTGPDWKGMVPKGMTELRSPTAMVWVVGRTQVNGKADYPAVHRLQDQYRLVPLSAWQKGARQAPPRVAPHPPLLDTVTPSVDQVAAMDAQTFFSRMALLMQTNPPAAADATIVGQMRSMGLQAGMPFKTTVLEPSTARAVQEGATEALRRITQAALDGSADAGNGWVLHRDLGKYGTEYLRRAATACVGLGASLPQDTVYATTRADANGRPLDGTSRYVLHFDKSQLPPTRAFWSVTLYNERYALISNAAGRYAISSHDRLRYNRDGSLDIYIASDRPANVPASNWLPAPADALNLTLRAYWPQQALLEGEWMPPPVQRVQ
jgi:hypothetical protein